MDNMNEGKALSESERDTKGRSDDDAISKHLLFHNSHDLWNQAVFEIRVDTREPEDLELKEDPTDQGSGQDSKQEHFAVKELILNIYLHQRG